MRVGQPLHGPLQVRLRLLLVASSALVAAPLPSEPCATSYSCPSPDSSLTEAPVLLQKTVKNHKTAPVPDETESPALAQESLAEGAKSFAEGLARGVGLLNPLLERTEAEYHYADSVSLREAPLLASCSTTLLQVSQIRAT